MHNQRLIETYIKAVSTSFYDFEGLSLDLEDTFNAKGLIVDKEIVSFDDSITTNE